jgi:hypothetical protein
MSSDQLHLEMKVYIFSFLFTKQAILGGGQPYLEPSPPERFPWQELLVCLGSLKIHYQLIFSLSFRKWLALKSLVIRDGSYSVNRWSKLAFLNERHFSMTLYILWVYKKFTRNVIFVCVCLEQFL